MPLRPKKTHAKFTRHLSPSEIVLGKNGRSYHLNIRPEDIAEKIIVVTDFGLVHRISRQFDSISFEMHHKTFLTHTGYYKKQRITVISAGIGAVNAEILLNELDALVNSGFKATQKEASAKTLTIVKIGTSVSIRDEIPVGSHLLSVAAFGLDSVISFYEDAQSARAKQFVQKLEEKVQLPFSPYLYEANVNLVRYFEKTEDLLKGYSFSLPGFYASQGRILRYKLRFPGMQNQLLYFKAQDCWISDLETETAAYYALGNILGHHLVSASAVVENISDKTIATQPHQIIETLIKKILEKLCAL